VKRNGFNGSWKCAKSGALTARPCNMPESGNVCGRYAPFGCAPFQSSSFCSLRCCSARSAAACCALLIRLTGVCVGSTGSTGWFACALRAVTGAAGTFRVHPAQVQLPAQDGHCQL